MMCFICNNSSLTRDCNVCYSFISANGDLSIYNINGNTNIYLSVYNNKIYLRNDVTNTKKFLFQNESFSKLSNKERYEYLKSIANNLEFL